jgi:predicted NBD/HSP70 family sugar kinase
MKEWVDLIREVVRTARVQMDQIAGLGLGLPGLLNRNRQTVHAYLPPGRWVDFQIGPVLASLNLPFTCANNVLCVSEYERRSGVGLARKTFLSVLARYGIGAALYARGQFLGGEEIFCGELGHMRLRSNGPLCICGQKGCLDALASGRVWPPSEERSGHAWWRTLDQGSRYLAISIANILKVFPSPSVILNGIYNNYQTRVNPVIEGEIENELSPLGIAKPSILFGEPVEFKASIGAAYCALDRFLEPFLAGRFPPL